MMVNFDIDNYIETKIQARLNPGKCIPIMPKINYAGESYMIPDKEPENEEAKFYYEQKAKSIAQENRTCRS